MSPLSPPATLYDKLWRAHLVQDEGDGACLIYIDRQLLHEVSSPQAFESLAASARRVRRPEAHLALADHAVPTHDRSQPIADPLAREQVALLAANAAVHGIRHYGLGHPLQGIVHVVGPELGFTQPGMTLVCGDSHTSTHGAFGALAFGIGASECEVVLATQTLRQVRAKTMRVDITGGLAAAVGAKDIALAIVGRLGAGGAAGFAIEYAGETVRALSMEGRMTLCNMTIEAGARVGLVAPDDTTFAYLEGRPMSPGGAAWTAAVATWRHLASDAGARFDRVLGFDVDGLEPQVTWGTSPDQVVGVTGSAQRPDEASTEAERQRIDRALDYMGLAAGRARPHFPRRRI